MFLYRNTSGPNQSYGMSAVYSGSQDGHYLTIIPQGTEHIPPYRPVRILKFPGYKNIKPVGPDCNINTSFSSGMVPNITNEPVTGQYSGSKNTGQF